MKITAEKGVLNLIVFIGCISVAIGVFFLPRFSSSHLFNWIFHCRFRELSGLPCISCGFTRSILDITKGRFIESLGQNPLGMWSVILWLWLLVCSGGSIFLQRDSLWKIFPWRGYILGGIISAFIFWCLRVFIEIHP